MINAVFIEDNEIFVVIYHTKLMCMIHFVYSFVQKKIRTSPVKTQLIQKTKNYPCNTFYDNEKSRVYIFYR